MKRIVTSFFALLLAMPNNVMAETTPQQLILVISVDQFSGDLFNEYRTRFTGGLKILQQGAVFPRGYQSHAATETCPGHSTILTGDHPARTGIVANYWVDLNAKRSDKRIYCVEDESVPGSTSDKYTVSTIHLNADTLGDRLKALPGGAQVIAVAGKDRAAVTMGGKHTDQIWWWDGKAFASFAGRTKPAIIDTINSNADMAIKAGIPAPALDPRCAARQQAISVTPAKTMGGTLQPLAAGDAKGFRTRPEFDQAVIDIATNLISDAVAKKAPGPILAAIGLSATDYVGHTYGTAGVEMCAQLMAVDSALDGLFQHLDTLGVRYAVVLTADHGGHDMPERNTIRAVPDARRAEIKLSFTELNTATGHAADPVFRGEDPKGGLIMGDVYLDNRIIGKARAALIAKAKDWLGKQDQVAKVFTAAELAKTAPSTLPPEEWSLAERAAASFDPKRSGALFVALKPRITPIVDANGSYVATHGSIWDYDRRVPILFWWPRMAGFEQPNSIETVDIMPTLAGLIGLPLKPGEVDGVCRDLDAGPGTTCPAGR